ncbi:MAG: RNA polymerase sigma factor [Planctomycetota bacterium]
MLRDRILIRKAKRGERRAFGLIYEKYRDTLLTVAMSLSADPELAQDVVQDVFVKFVESLDGFELRGRLKGYLATCVANRARDRLRQMARDNCVEQDGRDMSQGRPLDLAVQNEQLQRLAKALSQLPYEQREVIALKVHGGLSFRAIARQRGIRLGTVQSRYRYGLDRLRAQLNGKVKT